MVDSRSASRSGRSTIEGAGFLDDAPAARSGMMSASRSPSPTSKSMSSADHAMSVGLSNSGNRAATAVVTSVRSDSVNCRRSRR